MAYTPMPYTLGPLCLEHWLHDGTEVALFRCDQLRNQGYDESTGTLRRHTGPLPLPLHRPIDGGESIKYL